MHIVAHSISKPRKPINNNFDSISVEMRWYLIWLFKIKLNQQLTWSKFNKTPIERKLFGIRILTSFNRYINCRIYSFIYCKSSILNRLRIFWNFHIRTKTYVHKSSRFNRLNLGCWTRFLILYFIDQLLHFRFILIQ